MTQYKQVYYDCQICNKHHKVTAKWTKEAEISLNKQWGLNIEDEIMPKLKEEAKRSFLQMHPTSIFHLDRLITK